MTDEDLRPEYIKKMGEELGNLCHELRKEADWLQHKWNEFEELFQRGNGRVEVLNNTAPNFFYMVQQLLYEDAMLTLSQLTDPPKTSSARLTLTVNRLPDAIQDSSLKNELKAKTDQFTSQCSFARKWRHRQLAHLELPLSLGGKIDPLPSVTSEHVGDAIKSLREILNTLEAHYGFPFSFSIQDPWGAKMLLRYLTGALKAEETEPLRWMDLAKDEDD